MANLCASLCDTKNLDFDEWSAKAVVPYLATGCSEEVASAICRCAAGLGAWGWEGVLPGARAC